MRRPDTPSIEVTIARRGPVSMAGGTISIPENFAYQSIQGDKMNAKNKARAPHHPIAGRQPATNTLR